MSTSSSPNMISLITADAVVFEMEPSIAKEMQTIQSFIEEAEAGEAISTTIPLPNVHSSELRRIIEYLTQHRDGEADKEFDTEFLKAMKLCELKQLVIATHYLNVKEKMLDLVSGEIANRIENKSVEFARKFFGVENDFTPEEEAKIREERAWAFTGVDEDEYDEED